MRRVGAIAVLFCTLGVAQAARAQTSIAVLGLEPQDQSEAVARELTDALRQRAAATRGLTMAPAKDLVEIKLVFGCVEEAPACMAHAGKTLGADKVLFGTVRKVGASFRVTLKYLDVGSQRQENMLTDTVAMDQLSRESERMLAARWLGSLSGIKIGGALQISANVEGAQVFVDDKLVGVSGAQPVSVPQIGPGSHQIRVEKTGSRTYTTRVKVGSGEIVQVAANMVPQPAENGGGGAGGGAQIGGGDDHNGGDVEQPGRTSRILFWTALAATAASAAATVGYGLHTQSLEDDKKAAIASSPSMQIRNSGMGDNVCEMARTMDRKLAGICDDGASSATMTNVFLGVGIASLAASAWFYYKGYVDVTPERSSASTRVRVAPYGGTTGGGVLMEWEF